VNVQVSVDGRSVTESEEPMPTIGQFLHEPTSVRIPHYCGSALLLTLSVCGCILMLALTRLAVIGIECAVRETRRKP